MSGPDPEREGVAPFSCTVFVRWAAALILAEAFGPPSFAATNFVETRDLRVMYFDETGAYLVPYAVQCLVNSLAAQKARFGYEPDGQVAVLLQDFTDRGNAAAVGVPRNRVFIDLAPIDLAFETFSPGERTVTVANHELVHLVTTEMANGEDRGFRRWLGGKVLPVPEHPESILYQYLTVPRVASPRWYQEGSAVFMETWYGGGLGRAQGGYDEMVFRAMVRDGTPFYDPLALVSKGTEVAFQAVGNAYLYGTRFMSYLALQYGPEKLQQWWTRSDGSSRYYSTSSRAFTASRSMMPGRIGFAGSTNSNRRTSPRSASTRRPFPTTFRHADSERFPARYLSPDRKTLYAAVRYPGRVPHLVAISPARRIAEGARRGPGRSSLSRHVAGIRPGGTDTLLYDGQCDVPQPDGLRPHGRQVADAAQGCPHRRPRLQPGRPLALGAQDQQRFVILVRVPFPYTSWQAVYTFPHEEVAFDLDISPDGQLLSTSVAGPDPGRSGMQVMQVRVMKTQALLDGDASRGASIRARHCRARRVHVLTGRPLPVRQRRITPACRTSIATSSPAGKLEAMSNAEDGFFRPLRIR